MRLHELLVEGYKDAQSEFASASDPTTAAQIIDQYKKLVTKNQISGNERNIDWWRKKGWDSFREFVTTKSLEPTKTDVKRKRVVGKSSIIQEDNNWLIVIPLDKDASCFHGKNSDWCTTKQFQSHFENYFYDKNIVLIYCLNKQSGGMWAIAAHEDVNETEIFNQRDMSLTAEEFRKETGLDALALRDAALQNPHTDNIVASKNDYKEKKEKLKKLLSRFDYSRRSPEIESLLVFLKDPEECSDYIYMMAQEIGPSKYPAEIVGPALTRRPGELQYIIDPPEYACIKAVEHTPETIRFIKNQTPKIQMAAMKQTADSIRYIKEPTEEVQLCAVNDYAPYAKLMLANGVKFSDAVWDALLYSDGSYIQYIENPSEELQITAVNESGLNIKYIKTPTETAQLIAVKSLSNAIDLIENPSDNVKLTSVGHYPNSIRYIQEPTEEMQLIAVEQDPYVIRFIKNPTERVKKLAAELENNS